MTYDIAHQDETAHVHLVGALTFDAHRRFRLLVERLHGQKPRKVVLDLAGVEHIDAAGLGLLLLARDSVRGHGGATHLLGASGQVGRMLRLSRFEELFRH